MERKRRINDSIHNRPWEILFTLTSLTLLGITISSHEFCIRHSVSTGGGAVEKLFLWKRSLTHDCCYSVFPAGENRHARCYADWLSVMTTSHYISTVATAFVSVVRLLSVAIVHLKYDAIQIGNGVAVALSSGGCRQWSVLLLSAVSVRWNSS